MPTYTLRPSILHCNAYCSFQLCGTDSVHGTAHVHGLPARKLCGRRRSVSRITDLLFAESLPAHLHLLLPTAPALHISPVECCKCCKSCARFAVSSMEGQIVVEMVGLKLEEIRGHFLRDSCLSCAQNMWCSITVLLPGMLWNIRAPL